MSGVVGGGCHAGLGLGLFVYIGAGGVAQDRMAIVAQFGRRRLLLPGPGMIHSAQCSHHDPVRSSAPAFQASGSGPGSDPTQYLDLGLPGGQISVWMWPVLASTNVASPPSSCAER